MRIGTRPSSPERLHYRASAKSLQSDVDVIAVQRIGREKTTNVADIDKYYLALKMLADAEGASAAKQ